MIYMLFCVADSKVGAMNVPFACRARGEAVRSFQIACSDDKLPFKLHPSDYSLHLVGTFDDGTGAIQACKPERVIGADEF